MGSVAVDSYPNDLMGFESLKTYLNHAALFSHFRFQKSLEKETNFCEFLGKVQLGIKWNEVWLTEKFLRELEEKVASRIVAGIYSDKNCAFLSEPARIDESNLRLPLPKIRELLNSYHFRTLRAELQKCGEHRLLMKNLLYWDFVAAGNDAQSRYFHSLASQ
jgi:hypothetical protein